MNLNTILVYICSFSWGVLYANPLLEIYAQLDPIAVKFLVVGGIVPLIAIYMLFQDENTPNPKKKDIFVTVMLSMFIVWMGFEISIDTVVPVWMGLTLSFFLGLFSLELVLAIRKRIFSNNGLLDRIFKEIGNWVAKRLGNGKE